MNILNHKTKTKTKKKPSLKSGSTFCGNNLVSTCQSNSNEATMLLIHAVKNYPVLKYHKPSSDSTAQRNTSATVLVTQLMPGMCPWASCVVGCVPPSWAIWGTQQSHTLVI